LEEAVLCIEQRLEFEFEVVRVRRVDDVLGEER